jgi:heme exporter protein A
MLSAQQLSCIKGRQPLFSDVNFVLHPGNCLHLQGRNGVGKTSLLRVACGLARPASGQVLWKDQPLQEAEEFQQQLLYLGHSLALKEDLSPLENLLLHTRISPPACSRGQALQALAALGLKGREHLPVRVLSQGQKRRAALARLLLSHARLWILDEPVVALDAQARKVLCQALQSHAHGGGMVLFTSHQPLELEPGICSALELS